MLERVTHLGFSAGYFGETGDLDALDRRIAEITDTGATFCELPAPFLDVVMACRLIRHRVKALRQVLRRHNIEYSLHAPIAINLMDEAHIDLQQEAAAASLELAVECGAGVVVIHPGRVHPDVWVDQSEELLALEGDILQSVVARVVGRLGFSVFLKLILPLRRLAWLGSSSG